METGTLEDTELYVRWWQFAVFMPVLQVCLFHEPLSPSIGMRRWGKCLSLSTLHSLGVQQRKQIPLLLTFLSRYFLSEIKVCKVLSPVERRKRRILLMDATVVY